MGACLRKSKSLEKVSAMGLPKDRFTLIKKLGKGAEGELYLMKDKTRDSLDNLVAVKMIQRGSLVDETRVFREIMLQSTLNHIHVIKLFQILLTGMLYVMLCTTSTKTDLLPPHTHPFFFPSFRYLPSKICISAL